MKTSILACLMAFCTIGTMAQDPNPALTSKRGVPILPIAGDWGLGVNAVPFLNYIGNAFNSSTSNSVSFGFLNSDQTIFGKYFISDTEAIRASARIGFSSITTTTPVPTMTPGFTDRFVEDSRTYTYGNYMLAAGKEWRRGRGRVQGIYGGEAVIGLYHATTDYNYGNAFTADNPSVYFSECYCNGSRGIGGEEYAIVQGSDRVIEMRDGNSFLIGIRGFIGVEYFIAPLFSVAGEFGWSPIYQIQGDGRELRERMVNGELERREIPVSKTDGFSLDTDNLNGSIAFMFYF